MTSTTTTPLINETDDEDNVRATKYDTPASTIENCLALQVAI